MKKAEKFTKQGVRDLGNTPNRVRLKSEVWHNCSIEAHQDPDSYRWFCRVCGKPVW